MLGWQWSPLSSDPCIITDHEWIHFGRILQFTYHTTLRNYPIPSRCTDLAACLKAFTLIFTTCVFIDSCCCCCYQQRPLIVLCAPFACLFVFFTHMGIICNALSVCISCSYAELLQEVQRHCHLYYWCMTWVILTEFVLFRGILHPHKMLTRCCLCLLHMLRHDGLMQLLNEIPSFKSGPLTIMSALLTLGKTHVWTCRGNAHIINKYLM